MPELYLSDLSEKDKPWDVHKKNAELVARLYGEIGFSYLAERVTKCAQLLLFALAAVDEFERQFRLQSAPFCRVRQCPVCQWRRSLMWKARFLTALPKIQQTYPTYRWIFLTLTVKNCEVSELRQVIGEMNRAWTRLTQLKNFPGRGYVKSLEITRSNDGKAHPHIHSLIFLPSGYFSGKGYWKQEQWVHNWKKSLRIEYDPIVDVRSVRKVNNSASSGDIVAEIFKYSIKESDLVIDSNWLKSITEQLANTRAVSVGGILREFLTESEPDKEELIHGDDSVISILPDDPRFLFGWREMEQRYKGSARTD